jgi:hypothetical protein
VGPAKPDGTLDPPHGDVFAEMKGCLDAGISGRPALARFVEVTYEGLMSLKNQLDQIETRLSRLESTHESQSRAPIGNRRRRR